MLKKLHLTFSVVLIFLLNISSLKAELKTPNNSILPAEVIKIQLVNYEVGEETNELLQG